jgi:uncharacterized protein (TIGR02996 family)
MHDRDALLRAIVANPDDDAPRLVFADWLDEHGDPDRAEFIRVQCELGRLVMGTQAAFARYAAIQTRSWALFQAHRPRWRLEFGRLTAEPEMHLWYRRGMAAKVVCPVEYFLAHGERLFEVAPIEEVEFTQLRPADTRPLTACPWSRRVRRFRYVSPDDEDARMVRSLLQQWPFPGLHTLELRVRTTPRTADVWHDRWARVAAAVADSACLGTLHRLSLARCGVGDEGGRALADSPHLADLSVLDLTDNPLSPAVRYRLQDQFGGRVIFDYLDHAGFRVGDLFG